MIASSSPNEPVQRLLEAWGELTESDQRELVSEILRRVSEVEWPPLDDETIDQIADETFLEYDAREANQADDVGQPARPGRPLDEMNAHE